MTSAEALVDIRGYAAANRIVTSSHARVRMRQRSVSDADIRHALTVTRSCRWQPEKERWLVDSVDLDGDDLSISVVLDDGVVVVTVF